MSDDELPLEWWAREAARLWVSAGALGAAWAQYQPAPAPAVAWEDVLRAELAAGPPPAAEVAGGSAAGGRQEAGLARVLRALPDGAGLPAVLAALRREYGPPAA